MAPLLCGNFKARGGITIAQHPNTADYSKMPRSAINTGSIDYVLPPEAIAGKLEAIGMDPMAGASKRSRRNVSRPLLALQCADSDPARRRPAQELW